MPPDLPKSKLLATFHLAETTDKRGSVEHTLTNAGRIVKIETFHGVDTETARSLTEDGMMGVEALYANALSPYPGDISNRIVSDRRYLPQLVKTNWNGQPTQFYLLFANERLGYGAASADTVRHRSLLGWRHCSRKEIFYKVRVFFPLNSDVRELEAIFATLECP